MVEFDHVALSAGTLASGIDAFRDLTGIELPRGGEHPLMSTHNCVTSMGPDTFFELITVDPDAPDPGRARWFGLDSVAADAPLHARAILYRTDDIEGAIAAARELGIDLGEPLALTRGTMSWRFSVREDGAIPHGSVGPMLLQWDQPDPHPASRMPELGIRVTGLEIRTPDPAPLRALFDAWGVEDAPIITQGAPGLTFTLALPDGREVRI